MDGGQQRLIFTTLSLARINWVTVNRARPVYVVKLLARRGHNAQANRPISDNGSRQVET